MKRDKTLFVLVFFCLAASATASGWREAVAGDKRRCAFTITGIWKSEAITGTNPVLFSFAPDGWVRLLGHDSDALPQDFEVITEVRYSLDNPVAPKRIEFTARRGNDAFPPGKTSMAILFFSDDNFTTANSVSGKQAIWSRVQTHRYFLTFAARKETPEQGRSAFVMWTVLDGRSPTVEALGVHQMEDAGDRTAPVFGPIPAELYGQLRDEDEEKVKERKDGKEADVIMRLELNQAEFDRTHRVYQTWEKRVKTRALSRKDPYSNLMEFLTEAAESLNDCGDKVKLEKPAPGGVAEPHRRPLEYIAAMRKENSRLHVTDVMFPSGWRPVLMPPGH